MSEYWKSTPKYWCKHCSTYVRDTKLEKQNHEASVKHQGNLKRFLRDLHKTNDKEERDKQRAKDEVARLNGAATGPASSGNRPSEVGRSGQIARAKSQQIQATAADRKRQLSQLAEMGIAIPEEFRGDLAVAGDWEVTAVKSTSATEGEPADSSHSLGVRKRRASNEGLDDEYGVPRPQSRKIWGSSTKSYPVEGNEDLDLQLLLQPPVKIKTQPVGDSETKEDPDDAAFDAKMDRPHTNSSSMKQEAEVDDDPVTKNEEFHDNGAVHEAHLVAPVSKEKVKREQDSTEEPVHFKKRKLKKSKNEIKS